MRLLYIPFFSNASIGGCSIFNAMKVLIRKLVEQNPDFYVYYLVPESDKESPALKYLEHPRIHLVPTRALRFQEDDTVFTSEALFDLFNIDTGTYQIDAVICDKPRATVWAKLLVNNKITGLQGNVPFINVDQFHSGAEGLDWEGHSEEYLFAQVMGWYAGHNMFLAGKEGLNKALSLARRYAQGSVVKRIMDRTYPNPVSLLDVERLERFPIEKPKDEIRIHYGSRVSSAYKSDDVFESIEKLYQAGRNAKLVITSPANSGREGNKLIAGLKKRKMAFEAHFQHPQEEFYKMAASCHISLWEVKCYGTPLSFREQAFFRQAMVAPKFGAYEWALPDYPYLYSSQAEKNTILRHVVDNYWSDEVQGVLDKYQDYVRTQHNVTVQAPGIAGFIRSVVGKTAVPSESYMSMLRDVLGPDTSKWPASFTYQQLYDIVAKNTRAGVKIDLTYTGTCRPEFFKALRVLGYEDDLSGPHVNYVRKHE